MTATPMPVIHTHRSRHVCTSGCACRSWVCFECGTRHLVDREARYAAEPEGPDTYAVELCDRCGAPLCDSCVMAGSHPGCRGPRDGTIEAERANYLTRDKLAHSRLHLDDFANALGQLGLVMEGHTPLQTARKLIDTLPVHDGCVAGPFPRASETDLTKPL